MDPLRMLAVINEPLIATQELEKVLDLYQDYIISGCKYLVDHKQDVMVLLNSSTIIQNCGANSDTAAIITDFLINNIRFLQPVYDVIMAYNDKEVRILRILINSLIKYKDSLLNYLKVNVDPDMPALIDAPVDSVPALFGTIPFGGTIPLNEPKKCKPRVELPAYQMKSDEPDMPKLIESPKEASSTTPKKKTKAVVAKPVEKSKKPVNKLPTIKLNDSYDTIYNHIFTVKEWNRYHPFEDELIYGVENSPKFVIAGSRALQNLIEHFRVNRGFSTPLPNIKASDTDIFYLNCEDDFCDKVHIAGVDIIRSTKKTVEDLLLSFDLPCCRVAQDAAGKFYFTAQAFEAIFTGEVIMPGYCNPDHKDDALAKMYKQVTKARRQDADFYADRVYTRIKKYMSRGFTIKFVETEKPMEFLSRVNIKFIDNYRKD